MKATTTVLTARVPADRYLSIRAFAAATKRTLSDAIRYFAVLGCGGSASDAEAVNAEVSAMRARAVAYVEARGGKARAPTPPEEGTIPSHVHVRFSPAWARAIKDKGGLGKAVVRGLEATGRRA